LLRNGLLAREIELHRPGTTNPKYADIVAGTSMLRTNSSLTLPSPLSDFLGSKTTRGIFATASHNIALP